jgi:tRNA-2-methylthio-N6-dimethylallyladenosine synthase
MDDDLIAAHSEVAELMPYLHLPVQSGSDRILAAMNRRHTVAEYLDIVGKVRTARPDIALTSDIIVGFPGETDAEFAATLELVAEAQFAQAFSFKYSPRPGTPAAGLGEQVPEAVKTERLARLQALLDSQQTAFNARCVGQLIPVLIDKTGRRPGELVGRSPYLQPVHMKGPAEWLGRIMTVEISAAGDHSLSGVISPA